jgi:hypothetical protein
MTNQHEDERDSKCYLHRVDRLLRLIEREEEPSLDPWHTFRFVGPIDRSTIPLQKKLFRSRLESFLKEQPASKEQHAPTPVVSSELCDSLFKLAVGAYVRIAAWESMAQKAKNPEVDRSRRYLRQELGRYVKIRSLLRKPKQTSPGWIAEWEHCWVEACAEIQGNIEYQLRIAIESLDNISEPRKSAHADESAVLWLAKQQIRKYLESTPFKRKLEVAVAAFAYAARLVPGPEPKNGTADYVHMIKQRVSRVERSKAKRVKAAGFLNETAFGMRGIPAARVVTRHRFS